jgi:hypothetical protein
MAVSDLLETKQVQSYSYDETHCGYGNASEAEMGFRSSGYEIAAFELFQSRQNQMFGDTGISSRRFTWPDDSYSTDAHATYFAGMDASGMVATGSWRGPSVDFTSFVRNDGHAVPGFDFIDITPADRVFLDGVRNGYAFIEDRDFGAIDNQVYDAAKTSRPNTRNNAAAQTAASPRLSVEAKNQNENKTSTVSTRLSSEDFGITHSRFADHEVMVAYYGGDFRG